MRARHLQQSEVVDAHGAAGGDQQPVNGNQADGGAGSSFP